VIGLVCSAPRSPCRHASQMSFSFSPVVIGLLERDLLAGRVRDQLVEVLRPEGDAALLRLSVGALTAARIVTPVDPGLGDTRSVLDVGGARWVMRISCCGRCPVGDADQLLRAVPGG
jgi:hypothetical protein